MYDRRQAHRPAARPQSALRSPLGELEQAFLSLAHGAEPLMFPAHLVCDEPDRAAWPPCGPSPNRC
ncbi:hypothetical protein [Streptomyces bluensis]|uniref:hypothetical protein n=1 Tax=Streptomyces bluensis TaxID=33897 RepID=UPI001674B525|nr:hypothetical protein [Streptomyces bluensis]GGZ92299.1 hypothetical protein GCM10010344_70020 [Streptomyces bluensis]